MVPPPTTLYGAISYPLIREKLIDLEGEVIPGLFSPVKRIAEIFEAAAISIDSYGYYFEDINSYILLHFQQFAKDKQTGLPRRYAPRYRIGAVVSGRIYAPSGRFTVIYLVKSNKAEEILGSNWMNKLGIAAWMICRIGSRESIVSIEKVSYHSVKEASGEVTTKYYFPQAAGEVLYDSPHFIETFWIGGFGRKDPAKTIEYIVPGKRTPLRSQEVPVRVYGRAYRLDTSEVIVHGRVA